MIDGDDTFPSDMDAMLQLPGARDTVRALLKLALAEDTGELGCVVQRAMCVCYAHRCWAVGSESGRRSGAGGGDIICG